jgi:hypothetical protein
MQDNEGNIKRDWEMRGKGRCKSAHFSVNLNKQACKRESFQFIFKMCVNLIFNKRFHEENLAEKSFPYKWK